MKFPTLSLLALACAVAVVRARVIEDDRAKFRGTRFENLSEEDWELFKELEGGWEEGWEQNYLVPFIGNITPPGTIDDVRYYLWTRKNPEDKYVFQAFNTSQVTASPLDVSLFTYVQFHGFTDNGATEWIVNAKDALLNRFDCNVISVDYSKLVPAPFYPQAVMNVYKTANLTAQVLDWLSQEFNLDVTRVHIAGHSLGGHAAGMTGLYIQSGTVPRVTGIDPAGPLFYQQPANKTISPASGAFVDIIHANGGSILDGCYGLHRPLGHVDFYPNGGTHQPGCIRHNGTVWDLLDAVKVCSHERACTLWVESINAVEPQSQTFWAWPCKDWETFETGACSACGDACLQMGLPDTPGHPGQYYLRTASKSPFALGHDGNVTPSSRYLSALWKMF